MSITKPVDPNQLHRCEACGHEFRMNRMSICRPCPNCKRPVNLVESQIDDDDAELAEHKARLDAHWKKSRRAG